MELIPAAFVRRHWYDALSQLEYGTLRFTAPDGEEQIFGGRKPGPDATFRIHHWNVIRHAAARGDIALGEDFIDGAWATDSIEDLISVFLLNLDHIEGFAHGGFIQRCGFLFRNRFLRRNTLAGARTNIKAHYDVGNDFYRLWLDDSLTYSSALFDPPAIDLAAAQRRKHGRILDKFASPRCRVFEIGCGWGAFAQQAIERGHAVTAITISPAQYSYALARLGTAADVRLEDYRSSRGLFDIVVSIEMFEGVGEQYWSTFFHILSKRLKRHGKALIQTIVVKDDLFAGYRQRSDFIRHYVFPGGMLPSLARFRFEAERAALRITDVFSFGHDYARTLREWSHRLSANEARVKGLGHSDGFLRSWKFYLGTCAAAFSVERTNVVQVELRHA